MTMTTPQEHHEGLVELLRVAAIRNQSVGAAGHLATAVERLGQLTEPAPVRPATRSVVTEHLDRAVSLADAANAELAGAVSAARETLHWRVAYEGVEGDEAFIHFRKNYAFALLVAADPDAAAPCHHPELAMGFSLQAPNVHYGMHHHLAVEIYNIIGGTGEWKRNEGPWTPRPPGSVILHEAWDDHGMNTTDQPTLTWWTWVTDVTNSTPVMT